MIFEPIYYADRLRTVNPSGDVGVVTLWSPVTVVARKFAEWGIDLDPHSSRIAVFGNLYGNGLPHLFRNLLWNPQISHLLVLGQNLSGSTEHLTHFFELGLEEAEMLGSKVFRILGTTRFIDGLVTPSDFVHPPSIRVLGILTSETTKPDAISFFHALPPRTVPLPERKQIDLPKVEVTRYPSEPRSHTIARNGILDAWQELVFRLVRFGHRHQLQKGGRIELQNVKVIVQDPIEDSDDALRHFGFDPDRFREYQIRMLQAQRADETSYTYGNRIRGYYNRDGSVLDFIDSSILRLRADPQTRHAFMSLWDTAHDGDENGSSPCLVTLFLRLFDERLTLTATFRTHNAMSAWPENVWGLIAIQRAICAGTQLPPGPITVISHSISVDADPAVLARAQEIARQRVSDDDVAPGTGKRELRFDPNGEFTITIDHASREIVAQHTFEGMLLTEYRGKTARDIETQIARDCAISQISHALYVGRELAHSENSIKLLKQERSTVAC
jgi:thymidylate synthase